MKKKERERNDLAEGPRSRTERNDFKKVGTCPVLPLTSAFLLTFYFILNLQIFSTKPVLRSFIMEFKIYENIKAIVLDEYYNNKYFSEIFMNEEKTKFALNFFHI